MRYREFVKLTESQPRVSDGTEETGFYDATKDDFNSHSTNDTRKPKLTLKMINRLKKIRSTKNLEMTKKQNLLGIMYGLGSAEEDGI
jgi:hypothetical protein